MVKITEKSVCRGVAGRRTGSVKGIVIHNTWDNLPASYHLNRLAKANNSELAKGFAHYYIDENEIIRVEDTFNGAWHVANYDGNMFYIGYEVKGNRSTPSDILKQAEQNAFWQAAIDLRFYKLPVNRNTVMLHHQFSATECPKRSLIEHCGYDSTYAVPLSVTNKLKDYYIKEIKNYYDNPKLQPTDVTKPTEKSPLAKEPHKPRQMVRSYWFPKGHQKLRNLKNYCERNKIYFTESVVAGQVRVNMMWFQQKSPSKAKLIKYLEDNTLNYDIKLEFYENV